MIIHWRRVSAIQFLLSNHHVFQRSVSSPVRAFVAHTVLQPSANTMPSSCSHIGLSVLLQWHRMRQSRPISSTLPLGLPKCPGIQKRIRSLRTTNFRTGFLPPSSLQSPISSSSAVARLGSSPSTRAGPKPSGGFRNELENRKR